MKGPAIHLSIAVIALLAALGAYALGFMLVTDAKGKATELAAAIAAKEAEQARGASARSRVAEVASDEEFLASRLVAEADIVAFLETLESAGDPYGATVKVASVADDAGEERLSLALSIEGSFEGVMKTLGAIEHGRYALAPKDVSLVEGGEAWTLTGSFTALTRADTP